MRIHLESNELLVDRVFAIGVKSSINRLIHKYSIVIFQVAAHEGVQLREPELGVNDGLAEKSSEVFEIVAIDLSDAVNDVLMSRNFVNDVKDFFDVLPILHVKDVAAVQNANFNRGKKSEFSILVSLCSNNQSQTERRRYDDIRCFERRK